MRDVSEEAQHYRGEQGRVQVAGCVGDAHEIHSLLLTAFNHHYFEIAV